MKGHMYNIDNGYLEGLCRGFKNGILKQADYLNLVQCETLEGERESKTCHYLDQVRVMCFLIEELSILRGIPSWRFFTYWPALLNAMLDSNVTFCKFKMSKCQILFCPIASLLLQT